MTRLWTGNRKFSGRGCKLVGRGLWGEPPDKHECRNPSRNRTAGPRDLPPNRGHASPDGFWAAASGSGSGRHPGTSVPSDHPLGPAAGRGAAGLIPPCSAGCGPSCRPEADHGVLCGCPPAPIPPGAGKLSAGGALDAQARFGHSQSGRLRADPAVWRRFLSRPRLGKAFAGTDLPSCDRKASSNPSRTSLRRSAPQAQIPDALRPATSVTRYGKGGSASGPRTVPAVRSHREAWERGRAGRARSRFTRDRCRRPPVGPHRRAVAITAAVRRAGFRAPPAPSA
jgi:hypothetical protein